MVSASGSEMGEEDFPQTFEHKETIHLTIPPQQNVSEVRVPFYLPTPQFPGTGTEAKILPIRVAIEQFFNSSLHSVGVFFSFDCPDYVTSSLCVNPLTHGTHYHMEPTIVLQGRYGGFSKYFGLDQPQVLYDISSELKKLSEEVDTTYFGVQPSDVLAKAPRAMMNGQRYVLILTDEHNYASDAILQYLNDNKHIPLFMEACQYGGSNGGVNAVREKDWDEIFAPFVEKLKDIEFIPNNQYVGFKRIDGHIFGQMPYYWEGEYIHANLTDPHVLSISLIVQYLILKANADPNALVWKNAMGTIVRPPANTPQNIWSLGGSGQGGIGASSLGSSGSGAQSGMMGMHGGMGATGMPVYPGILGTGGLSGGASSGYGAVAPTPPMSATPQGGVMINTNPYMHMQPMNLVNNASTSPMWGVAGSGMQGAYPSGSLGGNPSMEQSAYRPYRR